MPLRIRCPKCGTVQRIPIGVRPTCQKCGFSGNSAEAQRASDAPAEGVAQPQWTPAPAPSAQAGQVAWGAAAAPEGQVAWDAAPGTGPVAGAAAGEAAGAESAEGWADAQWPQADAPEPKKKGTFRK